MMNSAPYLQTLPDQQLTDRARDYWQSAAAEIATGVDAQRFAALFSMASRYAKRDPLALPETCEGVGFFAWNQLELLRVALLLARTDLATPQFADEFEALFRFADEGETCALYRAIALLPASERFIWRAAEGCRSNMLTVFSAAALDTPFPVRTFDDTAWHQLIMKAVFVEAEIYRIVGLDLRLSAELTRMALDFAAERQSAGRGLTPGFWLIPGDNKSEALVELVDSRWPTANSDERSAMSMALGRAQAHHRLQQLAESETNSAVQHAIDWALKGKCRQQDFMRYQGSP